jgi:hypothetical protein
MSTFKKEPGKIADALVFVMGVLVSIVSVVILFIGKDIYTAIALFVFFGIPPLLIGWLLLQERGFVLFQTKKSKGSINNE